MNNTKVLIASLFISAGIACSGYFIGKTLYNGKVAINTAEAKGLAERIVSADKASWKVHFTITGNQDSKVADLYAKAELQQKTIRNIIEAEGFDVSEIDAEILNYSEREIRNDDEVLVDKYKFITGNLTLRTQKVGKVKATRGKVNKLIAQGYDLTNSSPNYYFTKLNDIKPAMLKEAAQNARIAATEFAENAGANVGKIRDARQGGFFVRDEGSEYGDTKKLKKKVRVVTKIEFYLND